MLDNGDAQAILEQLLRIQAFWERPVVLWQVVAFIMALLAAWLLTDGLWQRVGPHVLAWANRRLAEKGQERWQRARYIGFLAFPLLGLVTTQIAANIFEAQGWRIAFILDLGYLFNFLLLYRLFIALLYMGLGREFMTRYHGRLMTPLFVLIFIHRGLGNLIDLDRVSQVTLLAPFGNPITLGTLVTAMVALYFWFYLSRAIQDLLKGVIAPRTRADPYVIDAVLTIGRYIVIGIAVIIVAWALGANLATLAFISGGLSVGIGFGLQEIVANFISGILLLFEQSLRPGDVVTVDGEMGEVKKLSIRATTVTTFDNVELVVPNQRFLTSTVTTYTKSDRLIRVLVPVGVSYDSDPKEIRDILLAVADRHNLVQVEPAPAVHFMGFGDSSLDFRLAVWVDDPLLMIGVTSDLRFMIWKAFTERNIEIPFPQRDLHIRSGAPGEMTNGKLSSETSEAVPP